MRNIVVFTNNHRLYCAVKNGHEITGSSLDVLIAVRSAVHLGSRLLTHPLCGNLRPYQQPYRSVLVENFPGALVDLDSLSMIENAVLIYESCKDRLVMSESLDEKTREDYAFVDFELMRESMGQYGVLPKPAGFGSHYM